ncbi:hypothetical protein NQ317_004239 [Molorchus minor]|uniref:Uncharacterized protein n=1 Tax=Molorchus minor TaxID=1323400 RepID=A0ABQ9K1Z7_9CUCU|nr:hypothetical protein NQ317_004239 [Molorchus minor]
MIKAMLNVDNNQDISKFYKIIEFLKHKGEGYRPKKSKIFTRQNIGNTLVGNIPDSKTRVSRTFTVITETYIDLYRKYLRLRPAHVNH